MNQPQMGSEGGRRAVQVSPLGKTDAGTLILASGSRRACAVLALYLNYRFSARESHKANSHSSQPPGSATCCWGSRPDPALTLLFPLWHAVYVLL